MPCATCSFFAFDGNPELLNPRATEPTVYRQVEFAWLERTLPPWPGKYHFSFR